MILKEFENVVEPMGNSQRNKTKEMYNIVVMKKPLRSLHGIQISWGDWKRRDNSPTIEVI
jgi:hypothetical protein